MPRLFKKYSVAVLLPALFTLGLLLFAGCGYHHPAQVRSDLPPLKLAISNWQNQSSELAIQAEFLQELTRWCSKAPFISLAEPNAADYLLNGSIVSLRSPGHTYSAIDQAVELQAELTVRYDLTDQQGKIIIQQPAVMLTENYLVEGDAIRTRDNRRKALNRLFRDLAEEIYLRILVLYEEQGKT